MNNDDSEQLIFPGLREGPGGRHFKKTSTDTKDIDEMPSGGFMTTDAHEAIFHDIVNNQINVQVAAVAGSGKTTTVVEAVRRYVDKYPDNMVLVTAFNKDIVVELEKRVKNARIRKTNIKFKTMNSLGATPTLDWIEHTCGATRPPYKNGICTSNGAHTKMLGSIYRDPLLKNLSLDISSKIHSTFPWKSLEELTHRTSVEDVIRMMGHYGIHIPATPEMPNHEANERDMVERVLGVIKQRIHLLIDKGEHWDEKWPAYSFDEQIMIPLMFNLDIGSYDLVIVDESQDLNAPKQHLIGKLADKGAQIVAVGDPNQAIYAFAGADHKSMATMKKMFDMKGHDLLFSYRLPKDVQKEAAAIVPHIKCLEGAIKGEVLRYGVGLDEERGFADHLKESAEMGGHEDTMIVGRFNAQLIRLSGQMLMAQAKFIYVGKDIALPIRKFIEGVNKIPHCDGTIEGGRGLLALIGDHTASMESSIIGRAKKRDTDPGQQLDKLRDTVESARIIAESAAGDGVADILGIVGSYGNGAPGKKSKRIPGYIDKFMPIHDPKKPYPKGVFRISTIHKAKGLEADTVIVWGWNLMPSEWATQQWEIRQEENMAYVAVTRSKRLLELVNIEKWPKSAKERE
jgi:hypothetical protein